MDTKIVMLRSEFGMWGIGVYWTLLEFIAEQMKGVAPQAVATLSMRELCSFFGCKRNKLETFLKRLQNVRGMNYTLRRDILTIECPKLLEIKDNYHKDLEETSPRLPSKEVEEDVEGEVEEEKTPVFGVDLFDTLWSRYPRREGRKLALRHFLASVKTEEDRTNIQTALSNYIAKLTREKTAPQYIKMGSTWFNNWKDWIVDPGAPPPPPPPPPGFNEAGKRIL